MEPVTHTTILTPINGGHQETELRINWRGVTEEQLRTLAQRAVVAAIQQDYKSNGSCPAKDVVEAGWFVDRSSPSPIRKMKRIADLPKYLQGKPDQEGKPQKVNDVNTIFAGLTDEDKAAIIQLLGGK